MNSREFEQFLNNDADFIAESWQAFLNQQLVKYGYHEDIVPTLDLLGESKNYLRKFYRYVNERDAAFMKNAARILDNENRDAAVMVVGCQLGRLGPPQEL